MRSEFDGKSVAVIGMARSGLSCARALRALGAAVTIYDARPADQLAEPIASMEAIGVAVRPGDVPVEYAGLDMLVTSPGVRKNAPALQFGVAAGVEVIGEIEAAYRMSDAPILAITGTNGKTTTTALLGEMIRAAGYQTYIAGNIAAGDLAMPLTQAAFGASADSVIVAEISSFQLEWITHFRPKVAALLNITPDHGDRQTFAEYSAAKWRIFENQTPDDAAIVHESLAPEALRLGVKAGVTPFGGRKTWEQIRAYIDPVEILLPGRHNVENLCAAAAMASAFGIGPEPIREVARTFRGVVHRLEHVAVIDGVRYINNSMCTNVAAFNASLEAVPELKVVIVGGVFKGGDPAPLAESALRHNVKALVLIGQSAEDIARAARRAEFSACHFADDLSGAVAKARALASPGEVVMLAPACASFDMFKDFEDRGNQFKDIVVTL